MLKIYLRLGVGLGFLSAVADRFGLWAAEISAWGNWGSFVEYTGVLNPWLPGNIITAVAILATACELVFGLCILIGFKTELFAKLAGWLLLVFALAIAFSSGIKGALDYSVFAASGAAFALGSLEDKSYELDLLFE
jgi:thiosulfate dehydrogenase [quinone] large subunit